MLLAFAATWNGCTDKDADYVRLSNNAFTFSADGSEEFTVEIDANDTWVANYDNSWITVIQESKNLVTIKATPSRSNGIRKTQITITSGYAEENIYLTQLGSNVSFSKMDQNSVTYVISPNGKYVAGVSVKLKDNVYSYIPYVIDTQTGEKSEYPTLDYNVEAAAISDTGIYVLLVFNGSAKYYNLQKELIEVKLPNGHEQAYVQGVSSDGEIFVGYTKNSSDKLYYPIRWVNNTPNIMDAPTKDTNGNPVELGSMARGCSADGTVIYGSCWDDFTGIYWKDGGAWQYIGGRDAINTHQIIISQNGNYYQKTVVDRPILLAEISNISTSGRYIAISYQKITADSKGTETLTKYPAVFDVETGAFTILTELPGSFSSGTARTVSNKGQLSFACQQDKTYIGFVYDINKGTTLPLPQFVEAEYGFVLTSEESYIRRFAKDGEVILGGTYIASGSSMDYWFIAALE